MEPFFSPSSPFSIFLVEWMYVILLLIGIVSVIVGAKTENPKIDTLSVYGLLAGVVITVLLFMFSFRVSENEFAIERSLFSGNKKLKIVKEQGIYFSFGQVFIFSKGPIEINSYVLCGQMFDFGSEPVCKDRKYALSSNSFDIKNLDGMSLENCYGEKNTKRVLVYFAKIKYKDPSFVFPPFVKEVKE